MYLIVEEFSNCFTYKGIKVDDENAIRLIKSLEFDYELGK